MDADLGDLETQRFREEPGKDKFTQYALTIEGKIGNFDITYAGAYMHRPEFGDRRLHRVCRCIRCLLRERTAA